jgi:hypothetical protein
MKNPLVKVIVLGFVCGALSVAAFHQGTLHILYNYGNGVPAITDVIGRMPAPGWNLAPMPNPPVAGLPFAIPVLVNLMFWGGLWGILIAAAIRWLHAPDLLAGVLVGGLGATLVAVTLVAQMKGLPMWAGGDAQRLARALLLNGAFGFGAALLLRPFGVQKPVPRGH